MGGAAEITVNHMTKAQVRLNRQNEMLTILQFAGNNT